MKKLLVLLLALVMVSSLLAACGGEKAPAQTEAPTTEALPQAAAPEEKEGPAAEPEDETPGETVEPTFNRAEESTWDASVEIAAIMPRFGVYKEGGYKGAYNQAVCQCLTTDGAIEWLYIEIDDYKLFFDEDARLSFDTLLAFNMVAMSEPMRVDGTRTDAESLVSGLSDSIGSDSVIFFGNATVLSGKTIPESAYTSETPAMTCVYAELTSIVPAYTLSDGVSALNSHVVCRAADAGGDQVWVAISIEDYNAYIDESASLSVSGLARFQEMTYETPLVLHGITVEADSVASGLSDSIGGNTVIRFTRIG